MNRWVLLSCLLVGCHEEPTQLVIAVHSDLSLAEMDQVQVTVGADRSAQLFPLTKSSGYRLPLSLGVLPIDAEDAPVLIRVSAIHSVSGPLFTRTIETRFLPERSLLVPVFLARSCVGQDCKEATCSEDGCIDPRLDPTTLETVVPGAELSQLWETADGGRPDARPVDGGTGASDAGIDAGAHAEIDAGFDDAEIDAGFDDAEIDAGSDDTGIDVGSDDAGFVDGSVDAGSIDSGIFDAGAIDGGEDAQTVDLGLDADDASVDGGPPGFVAVAPGTFLMGSPPAETGRFADEQQHQVTITRPYWIKATEVTQAEWVAVLGSNPSDLVLCGPQCPVNTISIDDAVLYLNTRSQQEGLPVCYVDDGSGWTFLGLDCFGYRLPTEAEWEYAARGGALGALYVGALVDPGTGSNCAFDANLSNIGWYCSNCGSTYGDCYDVNATSNITNASPCGGIQPVGMKLPNALGLYDVLGNVSEWTESYWRSYPSTPEVDPIGPVGQDRITRGCSFFHLGLRCRLAQRLLFPPHLGSVAVGIRPVRTSN